ncbi:polycystin family receptor for egg jelly-like [Oculina patagonica]
MYVINVSAVSSGGVGPAKTTLARTDNPCRHSPCLNNGTCQPSGDGVFCVCPEKFVGDFCETFISAPTAPPGKVFAAATSPTSLFVAWGSVPEQHRHGQILMHKVYVSLANIQNDSLIVPVSGSNQTNVGGLEVYTLYFIRVSAVNNIGEGPKSEAFSTRTMASAPSRAPDLVAAYNFNSTSLVVKWSHVSKQYFHGKPTGYKIISHPVGSQTKVISLSVNYTTNTTTLTNLVVYTMYIINVSAVSSGGVGPGNMTMARTGAEAPSRAPDLVSAYNTSSTSLVVKWSHVAKLFFQGKPIGYDISYHPVGLEEEAISFSVKYPSNTTTLTDLAVYTMYVINVSAVSSGGVGPGNMTMALTRAGAPTRAPDLVSAYNSSSTSVVVKWSHVPKQYFHGKPIGYKIIYHPVGLVEKAFSFSLQYPANTTTLTDLAVYTMYVINVSAVSSGGVGPGNMAMARTDAGVPTAPPGQVSANATSPTSLLITWSSVPEQHRHGIILLHHVYITQASKPSRYRSFPVQSLNESHLGDLQPYTLYVIRVSARSNIGEGPKSAPITARTMEGVPSAAPTKLRLVHRDASSIMVEWDPIPQRSENGVLKGYKVEYWAQDNKTTVHETTHDEFTAILSSLWYDTLYTIRVAAFTSMGSGDFSHPIQVRTNKYDPCEDYSCQNGGICLMGDGPYCKCQERFIGKYCETYKADRPCRSPTVSLPSLSSNVASAVSVRPANQILIPSEVQLDCELSFATTFTWDVYRLYSDKALSRNGSSELLIPRGRLPVGNYLVRLTVVMAGTEVFGVGEGYIRVVNSPIFARIAGGTKVERGFNKTLVFDASLSRDPDALNPLANLSFTWICRDTTRQYVLDDLLEITSTIPSPSETNLDRGGCYGTGAGKVGSTGSLLQIDSGYMVENSSYLITVVVEKLRRRAYYTQEVVIVPGDPPEVMIICIDNCDTKLNPSRRLALEKLCKDSFCGRGLDYRWSHFKAVNQSHWVQDPKLQDKIRTRLTSPRLVTLPGVLEPNARYKFVLTAKRRGGHPGYSEYQATTNSPPAGGKCEVRPLSGVTLETIFTFTCSGWKDPDRPLQYKFIYFTTDINVLNVVYNGVKSSKEAKLPAGEKTNNFTTDFRVRVADMFGAFTEVKTPVQVLELQLKAEKLVDRAVELTTGNESQLTELIQSGDVSSAVQLAKAAIVAVDDDKKARPAVTQDQLTEKRKEMKSSIVEQLSAIKVETVERVQQTSNVIAEATSVISEVTVEAQKAAADALQSMTEVLKKESSAGKNYEALYDGARSLATGLGSILRVSSYRARSYVIRNESNQDSSSIYRRRKRSFGERMLSFAGLKARQRPKRDTAKEQLQARKESKERAISILNSLEEVGSTILSRTLVGEKPTELSAQVVSLLVSREEPDLLAGSVLSSNGNSFILPSVPNLFGNGTQFVDSQIITTSFVPFTWDPSGARVTTGVSSLELKNSTGHLLNMTELESPISIKLPNTQDLSNSSRSHYVGANKTVFHKINVTQSGMALILKVRPENNATEFVVSVKYGERPSLGNSDFDTTVPNFSSCVQLSSGYVNCSRDPYVVFVNNALVSNTGYYFIGIKIKAKTGSRKRRCSGKGRSKRSCVQYKDAPATDDPNVVQSINAPQYSKADEVYTFQVLPAACLYWSTALSRWTTEGCKVADTTTLDTMHCQCNHLTAFGGQLFVAPNPIDFDKVFTEFPRLPETGNVAVIVAVSCVFGLYLLLLLWARKADMRDALKIGDKPFLGSLSPWCYRYELQLSTGIWYDSGTSANVFIVLEGELGSSKPFQLKGGSRIPFARGSITSFTLSLNNNIGSLRSVRVWHDNSGKNPSWFLNTVKIFDSTTQELKTFVCYTWLAVEKGDGLIDRTLTSDATDEKRMMFKVSFQNRIAEEFSDGHLWFSVATRPPRRRFTRVQRLSCCLSLLLTTMLASAMFYEFAPGHDQEQGTLKLGRLVLNLRQLIIAIESLLVVIPVNLLIVGIFSRTKPVNDIRRERRYSITRRLSIHMVAQNTQLQKKNRLVLPHCFVYLAWILCFLSSVASATFIIFYSLQWGKDISEQWLISIVMSMFMDIFVSEPIKIVVVAFLVSQFCKSDFEETAETPSTILHFDDIDITTGQDEVDNEEDISLPVPPTERELRRARTYRIWELRMYRAIRKIVTYFVYLWILTIICYGGRSQESFSLTSSLQKTFGQLSEISSHGKMWDWVRDVLIPGIYEDRKDGAFSNSTPYIGDGEAVLVGMPRLRQLRVRKDSCEVVEDAKTFFNSCISQYSFSAEDKTQFYLPRWRPFPASHNTSTETLNKVCPKPWRYSSAAQTESLPFWGRISSMYRQGGYLAELGYDRNSASRVISELSQFDWFDRFTSAVLVEFTVFNSRASLFSAVWIPVEFSPSGHVVSSHVIRAIHVYNVGAGYSAALLICQMMFVLFIIYFAFRETKEMIQDRKRYFLQFLNWIELAQILTAIAFIVVHILKEIELFANTAKLNENIFQFISFDREVLLDDIETSLLALLMFFNTLKLLYLFRFNSHVKHLSDVMKASAIELLNYSLVFFVYIFAFSHFGFLQFGRELQDYSSPINAVQSLLIQGVVSERAKHLQDCDVIIGPLFFIIFNLFLQMIWINIFIAILIYDYQHAKRVSKARFSLGRFMIKKVKEILNCVGDKPKSPKLKKEGRTGKKRVSWKLDNTDKNWNKNKKERPQERLTESKSDPVSELDRQIALMNETLNDIYVDEFGGDIDMLSLWLDARSRGRSAAEKERAGTHSVDEGSRPSKDGNRASFPVSKGLKLTSVERGL